MSAIPLIMRGSNPVLDRGAALEFSGTGKLWASHSFYDTGAAALLAAAEIGADRPNCWRVVCHPLDVGPVRYAVRIAAHIEALQYKAREYGRLPDTVAQTISLAQQWLNAGGYSTYANQDFDVLNSLVNAGNPWHWKPGK